MKPIIMTAESVRAILDGRKTQTRRGIKPQPDAKGYVDAVSNIDGPIKIDIHELLCLAAYKPGDVLWVRETFNRTNPNGKHGIYYYKADGDSPSLANPTGISTYARLWKPPIHMPRAAARIFLRVTGVRAERVQEISDSDTISEGITPIRVEGSTNYRDYDQYEAACAEATREAYQVLWDSINRRRDKGAYAWEKNPWVWVYEFERVDDNGLNEP